MVVILGASASGKSSVEKILQKIYNMKKVVSYTTRNIRQGEQEGVDYYYISQERFDALDAQGFFAEKIFYPSSGCYYAAAKEDCTDDSIIVVAPEGLTQLLEKPELNIVSFYLESSEIIRFSRMIDRGDALDSIFKRIKEDRKIFKDIANKCSYMISNTGDTSLLEIASAIYQTIMSQRGVTIWNRNLYVKFV